MSQLGDRKATLRIACLIHSLAGGGAERVMSGLVGRLADRGHRVALITLDNGKNDRHQVDAAVTRHYLGLSATASGPWSKWRQIRQRHHAIRDAIRACEADVCLSFCDRMNLDVILSGGMLGWGRQQPPLVVSERSDPSMQSLGSVWNLMRKQLYPRAAMVVALSERSADYLRAFCNNVTVIPSAVDLPQLGSDRKAACAEKLVVAAGRLEPEKGFDRLVNAFAASVACDGYRLSIFGDGEQRAALVQQVEELGIGDRVEFPGWVSPLYQPLSKATLFVLSSRYEGFPSVLLESLALGVPALSTDCESGPRLIIEHGVNGWLVENSTPGAHRRPDANVD